MKRRVFFLSFGFASSSRERERANSRIRSLSLFRSRFSLSLFLYDPTTRLPDLLLLLLGQAARAGGAPSSSCPGSALGRLAAGRGDGAAVGGLLIGGCFRTRNEESVSLLCAVCRVRAVGRAVVVDIRRNRGREEEEGGDERMGIQKASLLARMAPKRRRRRRDGRSIESPSSLFHKTASLSLFSLCQRGEQSALALALSRERVRKKRAHHF